MTSPVVTRLLMRSPSSTRFCSRKVRSWVAATPPVSMRWRRSGSAPASTLLNAWSCEEKFRIADSVSIWPCRTVLLSLISAVVTSKLSLAVLMNELPLSMIVWRSSPVPANAAPSSSTVVFRSSLSTDSTVSDRWVSRVSVAIGRRVSCSSITESLWRYGPSSRCGWSSTYCSPTADRLPTTARVSAGISS